VTVRPQAARARELRVADVEGSCDLAFLHLVGAGLVGSHPDNLVTATLRTILREAQLQPAGWRWAA
jgi:hypothetical protein